jgi:hypothetical protein
MHWSLRNQRLSRRKLIGNQFDESQQSEYNHGGSRRHEGESRVMEVQPVSVSAPGHDGGRGNRTQAGDNAYKQRQKQHLRRSH